MQIRAVDVESAVKGKQISGAKDTVFKGVSIDSRRIGQDSLFICIKGNRFDGHTFINQAVNNGAAGIVFEKRFSKQLKSFELLNRAVFLEVEDTLIALGDLARAYRKRFSIPFIGITGSNGKTTVKELVFSVLSKRYRVLRNEGNKNNLIGVPLTLFNLDPSKDIAVIEMGTNHAGEIKRLCDIVCPDIGVITNISDAHIGNFGTIKDIQTEKAELIKSLSSQGTAVLNLDDSLVSEIGDKKRCRVIGYAVNEKTDITAESINAGSLSMYSFTLKSGEDEIAIKLPMPGYHNIYNALSAAAVGINQDLELIDIKNGIEGFKNVPMRMEFIDLKKGVTIINDAYNANLSSVNAALKVMERMPSDRLKIFIFGDMLELGSQSVRSHKKVGEMAVLSGIDILIPVGSYAKEAGDEALRRGMKENNVFFCDDRDDAYNVIVPFMDKNCCLLLKGSRAMMLEQVVHKLLQTRG